tara:strand:- start:148 stop:429 length:282 start_codon:yes stop_codon:yes gene_type:complete
LDKKEVFIGFISGLLATASSVIFLTLFLSDLPIEDSWKSIYMQGKLGGLISLGAIINLILFFFAIKKNKISFATGLVIISIIIILIIVGIKFM